MFNWLFSPPAPSQPSHVVKVMLIELAVVLKPIAPNCQGLIEYQGRCWNARCASSRTLTEKAQVIVIGDYGEYLLVAPFTG